MRDLTSRTEHQAGISASHDAPQDDDLRDHDEPTPVSPHECTSPDPERCLLHELALSIARQRAERDTDPLWQEHVAEQNRSHWT